MMNDVPIMLTIAETAARFKLPYNFVRRCVLDKRVPSLKAGKKTLINAALFTDFLFSSDTAEPEPQNGKIRSAV
jgi:excisionase family DNA binding protein